MYLIAVVIREGLGQAGLWAAVLAALAGIVAAVAAIWPLVARSSGVLPPSKATLEGWVVDRPDEVKKVVAALLGGAAGTVGLTTGLSGAGGFGKTTLARIVRADRRVQRRFRGRVYWVTVGRDARRKGVTAKVNRLIYQVAGENAVFSDPESAGQRLGSLLDTGPRRLLILDDVWEPEQLKPFVDGGRRCVRLVTTRVPGLVGGRGPAVTVDQMSPEESRSLLTRGLTGLNPGLADGLLAVTGRWPLLLRLVNKILVDAVQAGQDLSAVGAQLLDRLRLGGPAVVDELSGTAGHLDVGKPAERERAVRATIQASTNRLDREDTERFAELGIFAEDETIPFGLAARLWQATAGLDELQAVPVYTRLIDLGLVSSAGPDGTKHESVQSQECRSRGVSLHDVVRDFLRAELGQQRLAGLTGMLLDAVAADLPTANPRDLDGPRRTPVAWWDMGDDDRYLWDHLIEHMVDAGRPGEAETIACDLRWVGARLDRFEPAAPAADLSAARTPRAARLWAVLARTAHLLAPAKPAGTVVDVLHSRVADDPDWGPQVTALRDIVPRPRLVNRWPLPDLPDAALRRVLTGHRATVFAVAIAPDGSWLASGSGDRTVRIWDAATGQAQAPLTGQRGIGVIAVAIAADGSWLASAGGARTARIWKATGQVRASLTGHYYDGVYAVAIAPDGRWLATGSDVGTVQIWDVATGRVRATLTGHHGAVFTVAVAPDCDWLASGGGDGTVRIWDAATGQERATLTGHHGAVRAVAVAPDCDWLASGGADGTVRIWDAATGQERATLSGHHGVVFAVAVAPGGRWLASGGADGTVRIWDAATGQERASLTGHHGAVSTVAIAPDSDWLASGGADGTVRIWDAISTGRARAVLTSRHRAVNTVAVAPDARWFAAASDGTVRIWDAATGHERATLTCHHDWVYAVAVAPDGRWLAMGGSDDRTVRIWDVATRQERATLTGHHRAVTALAIAPDGRWLAAGSDGAVEIWDVATGRVRVTLTGHHHWVYAVAIAPDGRWLATAGSDGTVRTWDVATGRARTTLTGHNRAVNTLAVAPDGRWLVSGGNDGTVRIWDVTTGQAQAPLTGTQGRVYAVAVAPDGHWLAVGSDDGTVRIWDAATGEAKALMRIDNMVFACAWLSSRVKIT